MRGEDVDPYLTARELHRLKQDAEYYQIDGMLLCFPSSFDPRSAGPKITLSNNNRTATNTGGGDRPYVLSSDGYCAGGRVWKVTLDTFGKPVSWFAIGVAHKDTALKGYGSTYSLSSINVKYTGTGLGSPSTASGDWQEGDTIEVTLDCDSNSLAVQNLRTTRQETWALPSADGSVPWHLYVNAYYAGDQVTIQ